MERSLNRIALQLAERLLATQSQLVTAESCTGGWVAKVLTDIPGSSSWFERGLITYSNAAKRELLGVPAAVLEEHGAVSQATIEAMVEGLFHGTPADVALAVSGIAGPGGGSAEKPVGTVWFGWGRRGEAPRTRVEQLPGDRDTVRREAVRIALTGVLRLVD